MAGKDTLTDDFPPPYEVDASLFLLWCLQKAVCRLKKRSFLDLKTHDTHIDHADVWRRNEFIVSIVKDALFRDRRNDKIPVFLENFVKDETALLQAIRINRVLKNDFGIAHGIASPAVIVLDLYPMDIDTSNEIIRQACNELVLGSIDLSSEENVNAFKNKFWTMDNTGFSPLISKMIDPTKICDEQARFLHENQSTFGAPASCDENGQTHFSYSMLGHRHSPVLVVLGLFSEPRFLHGMGSVDEMPPVYTPHYRQKKPFTRHDESMFIFSFVEELILACGQGLAAVLAPSDLCRVPEAVGMRKRWVKEFDSIYVDATLDTALYQLLKLPKARNRQQKYDDAGKVYYNLYDDMSPSDLLLHFLPHPFENSDNQYQKSSPNAVNKYSLIPPRASQEYLNWMSVVDIPKNTPSNGLMEKRGGALIDIDADALTRRMRAYLDPGLSWHEYTALGFGLTDRHINFKPEEARERIIKQTAYNPENIRPYAFKPFDIRKCYYSTAIPLWNDHRAELARQFRDGNNCIVTRPAAAIEQEGNPFFLTTNLTDGDLMRGHAYCIPFLLYDKNDQAHPNLSPHILDYLLTLGIRDISDSERLAKLVWHHVLAIGFSPSYLAMNNAALQYDWPRIPFPIPAGALEGEKALALLERSAALGELVGELLIPELPLPLLGIAERVTPYSDIAALSGRNSSRNAAHEVSINSIALKGKWGYEKERKNSGDGTSKNVMPGSGRLLRRGYTNKERLALENLGAAMGLHAGAIYVALGIDTCDIFINQNVYWRNVPSRIWEYRIGGYPVLKKWLSYREYDILKRELRCDEVIYFSHMAHRLTTLCLLEGRLDTNFAEIRDHGGDPQKGKS